LLPWRTAEELKPCFLYWVPVAGFLVKDSQREWLVAFLDRFAAVLTEDGKLRVEHFLSIHAAMDRHNEFQKGALRYSPLIGLSRRPGEPTRMPPDIGEMQKDAEAFVSGAKKPPELKDLTPDYCFWFLIKYEGELRQRYFGHGGMTMLVLEPDPNTVPPEEFEAPDVFYEMTPGVDKEEHKAFVGGAFALRDKFLPQSKELFGKGLEEEPQYPGIVYIVPSLRSEDFFKHPDEVLESWFELFSVYITESPDDRGILLAAKEDQTETIIKILREMREEGLSYPVA